MDLSAPRPDVLLVGFRGDLYVGRRIRTRAIRWQSIQILHVIHFLWPPFLFAGLYRRVRARMCATRSTVS